MIAQRLLTVAAVAGLAAAAAPAGSAATTLTALWTPAPTTEVNAVAQAGSIAYVAGPSALGHPVNGVAVLDAATGALRHGLPGRGAFVALAAVPDGAGGWYIGGRAFDRAPLVRLRADGTLDPRFRPALAAEVTGLALADGRLHVGGRLPLEGPAPDQGVLFALNPATGARVPGFDPGAVAPVDALAVAGGSVLAGSIADDRDPATAGLRRFDPATGAALPSDAPPGLAVRQLAADGARLVAGLDDGRALALDPTTGASLPEPLAVDVHNLNDLAIRDDTLFAAFGATISDEPSALAADLSTGSRIASFAPPARNAAWAISASVDAVHLGVNASFDDRRRLLALDPATGAPLPGFATRTNGAPSLLVADDRGSLLAGGLLTTAGAAPAHRLAAIDLRTGERVRGFRGPQGLPEGPWACAMVAAGPRLVLHDLGGARTQCEGGRLLVLSRATGDLSPVSATLPARGVHALAGGRAGFATLAHRRFTGVRRVRAYRLDGRPAGLDRRLYGRPRALAVRDGIVYVAGHVALRPGAPRAGLLAFALSDGRPAPGVPRRPGGSDSLRSVAAAPGGVVVSQGRGRPRVLWRVRAGSGGVQRLANGAAAPLENLRVAGGRVLALGRRAVRLAPLAGGAPERLPLPMLDDMDQFRPPQLAAHGDTLLVGADFEAPPATVCDSRLTSHLARLRLVSGP